MFLGTIVGQEADDPDAARIRGGTAGAVIGIVLIWVIVVLVVVTARRRRHLWKSAVDNAPLARLPAVITDQTLRGPKRADAYLRLRLPHGDQWTVLVVQGRRRAYEIGDEAVVEIYPADNGGCVGAFRVARTGEVCQFSSDRLPQVARGNSAD